MFKTKTKPPPELLKEKTDYRQKLIDLCREHNTSLEEVYYNDKVSCIIAYRNEECFKEYLVGDVDLMRPYRRLYERIVRKYSKRVVKLV